MTRFSEAWYAQRQMQTRQQSAFASLVLPWPPTVNHTYRPRGAKGGTRYLTEEAKKFRADVGVRCVAAGWGAIEGRLRVTMHACPPDKRKRDIDNIQKATLDALQHAGLYADDSQIDDLRILRTTGVPGSVTVFVEKMRDADGSAS